MRVTYLPGPLQSSGGGPEHHCGKIGYGLISSCLLRAAAVAAAAAAADPACIGHGPFAIHGLPVWVANMRVACRCRVCSRLRACGSDLCCGVRIPDGMKRTRVVRHVHHTSVLSTLKHADGHGARPGIRPSKAHQNPPMQPKQPRTSSCTHRPRGANKGLTVDDQAHQGGAEKDHPEGCDAGEQCSTDKQYNVHHTVRRGGSEEGP